jgi:glycosidase
MKNRNLSLFLKGDGIGGVKSVSTEYKGIRIVKTHSFTNKNYLQVDIFINAATKPGKVIFQMKAPDKSFDDLVYELKPGSKENGKTRVQGVTSKDFIYLMMPDRFANGDPSNDAFDNYMDKTSDRENKYARHGGDLKGAEEHLDYFNELGVTALWFTPLTENDMPKMKEAAFDMSGYHGYWFTNQYKVDQRFGGNEAYRSFINAAHKKGLKIIQDAVYNHIGLYHWINQDPPDKDWVNQWPEFTGPNHRVETIYDPYVSKTDNNNMLKGWFVKHLPDLNLANPFVATFLIQHAIWSVEEFGFDGFRVDTYKYCDERFLNKINEALLDEFSDITTFVEAWANSVAGNAYFVRNNLNVPFKHNAQGALDFPLCNAMLAAMKQDPGWSDGVNQVYSTLAQDFLYKDPLNNCIFLDNHDMDRVYSVIGEDWTKMKWGINWLLTLRGIPQLYYGTEILMKNFKKPTDAEVRLDFPGGWPDDKENKFTAKGRTEKENEAFNYISKLANFRKNSSALTTGNTMQYIVRDGVYIYFRYSSKQTVMVITNSGSKTFKPDWDNYNERTSGFSKVKNVIDGKVQKIGDLEIQPNESFIFELIK